MVRRETAVGQPPTQCLLLVGSWSSMGVFRHGWDSLLQATQEPVNDKLTLVVKQSAKLL